MTSCASRSPVNKTNKNACIYSYSTTKVAPQDAELEQACCARAQRWMATKYIPGETGAGMRSWLKGTDAVDAATPFTRTWARDCEETSRDGSCIAQAEKWGRGQIDNGMGTFKCRGTATFNLRLKKGSGGRGYQRRAKLTVTGMERSICTCRHLQNRSKQSCKRPVQPEHLRPQPLPASACANARCDRSPTAR